MTSQRATATREAFAAAVEEVKVPQDVQGEVELGADKSELQARLRQPLPWTRGCWSAVRTASPATVSSSGDVDEAAGGTAEDPFRFCFVEDELVDKTVVLRADAGAAG